MRFHMRTAHEERSKFDYAIEDSGEIVNVCIICSDNVEPGISCTHEKAFTNGVGIVKCRVKNAVEVNFRVNNCCFISRIAKKRFTEILHLENIAMWNMVLVKFVKGLFLDQPLWLDIMSITKTSE